MNEHMEAELLRTSQERLAGQARKPRPDDSALLDAASSAAAKTSPSLHICRERDVGLFSLIQQVIGNIPWALAEGRVPVVHFGDRCSYYTPAGHHGAETVWEYYFEPLLDAFPAAVIPEYISAALEKEFPEQTSLGVHMDGGHFVTNSFGEHPNLQEVVPQIPYTTGDPRPALRRRTSEIIDSFVRPRPEVRRRADAFYEQHLRGHDVIGVHARGTDAVSSRETRSYRQGSLSLERFNEAIVDQLRLRPNARVLVATDEQRTLDHLAQRFGERVVALDAIRHHGGEPAGSGPTGCIMPAYVTADRDRAAQNGEDAVVEWLLLTRCRHMVHNGASLAVTALLAAPDLSYTNTRRAQPDG